MQENDRCQMGGSGNLPDFQPASVALQPIHHSIVRDVNNLLSLPRVT
jgi:hypothetical protein